MSRIALDSSPFYGSTSRPVARLEHTKTECLACGSSLHGRRQGMRTWGTAIVEIFACPCGRRRRLEVASR